VMKEAASSDGRPTFVRYPSTIAYGAPTKANSYKAHGSPLGAEEVAGAKRNLGWDFPEPFTVPDEVRGYADQTERGRRLHADWDHRFAAYAREYPALAAEFRRLMAGELPDDWDADLPEFETGEKIATRKASGKVINALAPRIPELFGGSADLSTSNNTIIEGSELVAKGRFDQRNVNYGVREHAMCSIMSGLALHGGVRPFGGTFLTFSDYGRPGIRLACLMGIGVIYVMTHDSIGLGEDGPTHQPIEHLAALRAIPNLHVLRPADARETAGAWRHAVARTTGPTLLALTRQDVPVLESSDASAVGRGAYVVVPDDGNPEVVLLATGSEVHVAVEAGRRLAEQDVAARVVSMPSWELFEEQDEDYQEQVLPAGVPTLSIEAASSFGWDRWADDFICIDRFGESAPGPQLLEHFGFTPDNVVDAALDLLEEE
jgi:transketolase